MLILYFHEGKIRHYDMNLIRLPGVKTTRMTERDMIVVIAEATTNAARRGRGWQKPGGMGSAGGSSRGGDGGVEKLADYSIVEPVVSVNRNAPWTFVVLLRACSLHSD